MAKKIKVTQIRDGKRVTFLTPDKGKPGKTPKEEQWYEPSGVESGWKKDMPEGERRRLVLKAHKGDDLSSARSMQAKVNVTTDRETKQKARADAQYFFRRHRIGKRPVTPEPKVEKRRATIEGIKGWPEAKKAWVRREANKLTAKGLSPAIQELGWAYDERQAKKRVPRAGRGKPRLGNLQQRHARRSTQAQARDEQQTHQVTIEVDSPRVKVWLKDPSAADIKGIDTPSVRRGKTRRITPPTPRLRR